MALFNLTDIAYKAVEARDKFVPLVSKVSGNAERNRYYQNMRRYPIDLGSVDRGHYMLIHINVQDKSSYKADFSKDIPTIQRNRTGLQNQTGATNIGGFANLGVDNLQRVGGFIGENTPDSVIQGIERVKEGFASFVADKITPAARSNIGDARLDRANDVFENIKKFGSGVKKGLEDQVGNLNNANLVHKKQS
jgi:hypothetical protein